MSVQLRPGYKQTEVGVIPEDWAVKPMGKIGVLSKGKGLLKENLKTSGAVPAIPYTALYTDFSEVLDYEQIKWFVDDAAQTIVLSEPCILIASSSNMAENTGKASALIGNTPVAIGREVIVFRSNSNASYISYLLSTSSYRKKTLVLARGTTIKHLYPATFVDYKIGLPSIAEQQAIAEALSDTDALIESLEQLIAKKCHIKQGTMQELLTGKKRLPGFSGKWETKAIASFSAFVTKGATPTTYGFDWTDDGVRFLRSECVSSNGLDLTQSMFISEAAHTALSRGEVREGDILITITGNVGRVVRLPANFGIANINQHIARIRINAPNVSSDFVFHFLSQATIRANYALITTGQAYPQISLKQVRETLVPLPSFSEQAAIASALSDMDAEIAELETQLVKTRALKQGMMHKLLTGEIRLI